MHFHIHIHVLSTSMLGRTSAIMKLLVLGRSLGTRLNKALK